MTTKTMSLLMRLVLVTTVVKITVFAMEATSNRQSNKAERSMPLDYLSKQRELQSFYSKYPNYPPYCSIPEEMNSRKIPPLEDLLPKTHNKNNTTKKSLIGETRLVHVTAVIRHGARTPWSSEMKCWDGYWENPQTGVWDCEMKTMMASPSRGMSGIQNSDSQSYEPLLLFEKAYDALAFPEQNLGNVLNGTCQMGQLLEQGYEQQIKNGRLLREAYAYREGEYEHDQRMRLLNIKIDETNDLQSLINYPSLYFRADDYQRTVMSGQVLLRSLLDPELTAHHERHPDQSLSIPLHIADETTDIVDANEADCPKLKAIKEEAIQSNKYQTFYNSQDSQEIREYLRSNLNMGDESEILDCFMCTLCTDRPLPVAVDDYDPVAKNDWFTRATEYEIQKYTTIMKHDNAAYAKLSLGPLWFEIMKHINNVLDDKEAPKLSLFAGHDTTIMPLLASLGPKVWKDDEWASYASMMLIEIHELIDGRSDPEIYTSNFAFRLLYNGNILTPLIEGCHEDSELCDIKHLKTIVDPIATRHSDCHGDSEATQSSEEASSEQAQPSIASTTSMAVLITLVLMSGLGGSAVTFAIMRQRFKSAMNYRSVDFGGAWSIDDDDDEDYGLELTEGTNTIGN